MNRGGLRNGREGGFAKNYCCRRTGWGSGDWIVYTLESAQTNGHTTAVPPSDGDVLPFRKHMSYVGPRSAVGGRPPEVTYSVDWGPKLSMRRKEI